MLVTITTDGGFTGRGIGSASGDVDHALFRDAASWRDEYTMKRGADLVRYTLTFGERSVSWVEGAEIPEGLREVFEEIWERRR